MVNLILAILNLRSMRDRVEISRKSLELRRKSGQKCELGFYQHVDDTGSHVHDGNPLEMECRREGAQDKTHRDCKRY